MEELKLENPAPLNKVKKKAFQPHLVKRRYVGRSRYNVHRYNAIHELPLSNEFIRLNFVICLVVTIFYTKNKMPYLYK